MQTSVEMIKVVDRNGSGAETRMMSIRMSNGELKTCLLQRLLRDDEVVSCPRELAWELVEDVRSLAARCGEATFPDARLAGAIAYLADNPEATPAPSVIRRLLARRKELRGKLRQIEREQQRQARWLWQD